jgi:HK97 family phage major capsid protein
MKGPNYYRSKIADPKLQSAARTEFAKLGFDVASIVDCEDGSFKEDRRNMRRVLNEFQELIRSGKIDTSNKDGSFKDCVADAITWASSVIAFCDEMLEASDGSPPTGSTASNALRDQDGRRIGTVLTNSTLRDIGAIANQLGAHHSGEMGLADFLRGVAKMRTTDAVRNTLTEGTNTAGGYTVPTILLPGILNALTPSSSLLRAGASMAVLQDGAHSFNIAGVDSIPTAAWRSESGNVAESDPAFRSISIVPRSLAFRFKVSRELLADSPNLEQTLRIVVAGAFAKELDRAGLRGSGTAPEIRGLLNTPGIHGLDSGVDGAVLTNYAKFINAARLIKDADAPPPNAAIMSPREDETLALFQDSTGQPLRKPEAVADWNFLTTSQIPTNLTVGTSTDCSEIYVGDFSQFVFFMREGVSIQLATELYAATGEVGFICHTRVDVAALYAQAFAVITGVRAA